MIVAAPMDEIELRNMMYTAQKDLTGPFSIRYPRGNGSNPDWRQTFECIEIGKSRILRRGEKVALISIGDVGHQSVAALDKLAGKGMVCTHMDVRFLKPLDEDALHQICADHGYVITIENGTIIGGLGSAVADFILKNGYSCKLKMLGIPDQFIEHGTIPELQKLCGIDQENIEKTVESIWM
jgi:1-deoxy-D-xylulose-5-phosphate synthase